MIEDDWKWDAKLQLQDLPSFWKSEEHDKMLVNGILKHGAGKWMLIAEDKEIGFSLAEEEEEEVGKEEEEEEEKGHAPKNEVGAKGNKKSLLPEPRVCIKRVKQICNAYRRHLKTKHLPSAPEKKETSHHGLNTRSKRRRLSTRSLRGDKDEAEDMSNVNIK